MLSKLQLNVSPFDPLGNSRCLQSTIHRVGVHGDWASPRWVDTWFMRLGLVCRAAGSQRRDRCSFLEKGLLRGPSPRSATRAEPLSVVVPEVEGCLQRDGVPLGPRTVDDGPDADRQLDDVAVVVQLQSA